MENVMNICVVTTVKLQKITYYRGSRPKPLLKALKVVYEIINIYDTTYPNYVIDKMHFPKHIWRICLKYFVLVIPFP